MQSRYDPLSSLSSNLQRIKRLIEQFFTFLYTFAEALVVCYQNYLHPLTKMLYLSKTVNKNLTLLII